MGRPEAGCGHERPDRGQWRLHPQRGGVPSILAAIQSFGGCTTACEFIAYQAHGREARAEGEIQRPSCRLKVLILSLGYGITTQTALLSLRPSCWTHSRIAGRVGPLRHLWD